MLHGFWLFRSEAISRSVEVAGVHGDQLRVIVGHALENGTIGVYCLLQSLFVDVDLATGYLGKTMFDVDAWFLDVLTLLLRKGKSILLVMEPEVRCSLSCIVEVELLVSRNRNLFIVVMK